MEKVGSALATHVAEARRWTTTAIMERAKAVTDEMFAPGGRGRIGLRPEGHMHMPNAHDVPWWAFVDGWVIPEQTQVAYREGKQITVPLLAGTNANEGSVFLQNFPVTTQPEYRHYLNSNYAPCGAEMFAFYPASSSADIKAAVDDIIADALFLYGVHGITQAEQDRRQQMFLYRFSRGSRDPKLSSLGAWHGAEIPYVFGLTDQANSPAHFDMRETQIAEKMMNAWTNFAKAGKPSSTNMPPWPAATQQDEHYMNFGDTTALYRLMKKRNFAVFDRVFSLRSSKTGC
jgi:para-nitrobenzyl esterase